MSAKEVRYPGFAERFQLACDGDVNVPPNNFGRLTWISNQLKERYGVNATPESVRRWSTGLAQPRREKLNALAQLMGVDPSWLAFGSGTPGSPTERKLREAEQDGAVNVLAGTIHMCGGSPAFPAKDDVQAQENLTDLYAIIKGAQYSIHVVTPQHGGATQDFAIPLKAQNSIIIAVVMAEGMQFSFFELPWDEIQRNGQMRSGSYHLSMSTDAPEEIGARRIETFSKRL